MSKANNEFLPSAAADEVVQQAGVDAIDSDFDGPRNATGRVVLQTAQELVERARRILAGGPIPQTSVLPILDRIAADIDAAIMRSEQLDGTP